ncbi:galactose oxidase, partial [Rozella allomycis CSF55]
MRWTLLEPVHFKKEEITARHGHSCIFASKKGRGEAVVPAMYSFFGAVENALFNEVVLYDINKNNADIILEIAEDDKVVFPVSCCAICKDDNEVIYLFGGISSTEERDEIVRQFVQFDIETKSFKSVEWTGECPPHLLGAKMNFVKEERKIYLFGGYRDDFKFSNDLYSFDLETNKWELVECNGMKPRERESHSMEYWECSKPITLLKDNEEEEIENGKFLVVFGGLTEGHRLNDVQFYNLNNKTWYQARTPTANEVTGRSQHSAFIYKDKIYILFGWEYSTEAQSMPLRELNEERTVAESKNVYSKLKTHSKFAKSILMYDIFSNEWTKKEFHGGIVPTPRVGHGAAQFEDKIYVFGGRDGPKRQHCLSDFWMLELEATQDEKPRLEYIGKRKCASEAPIAVSNDANENEVPEKKKRKSTATAPSTPAKKRRSVVPTIAVVTPRQKDKLNVIDYDENIRIDFNKCYDPNNFHKSLDELTIGQRFDEASGKFYYGRFICRKEGKTKKTSGLFHYEGWAHTMDESISVNDIPRRVRKLSERYQEWLQENLNKQKEGNFHEILDVADFSDKIFDERPYFGNKGPEPEENYTLESLAKSKHYKNLFQTKKEESSEGSVLSDIPSMKEDEVKDISLSTVEIEEIEVSEAKESIESAQSEQEENIQIIESVQEETINDISISEQQSNESNKENQEIVE